MEMRTMTDSTALSENERTWENFAVTFMTLQRARELELAKVGLTIPQAGVLYFLETSTEPLTPMKLARRMNRQPHTVSALVARMEAQGLVKTAKDLQKKNWVRVSLTKKGKEAFNRQMSQTTARSATACLSKKELDQLNSICRKLRAKGAEQIRQMQPSPYNDPLF
jgi:DNA-binding MarR family transcriptional regulator